MKPNWKLAKTKVFEAISNDVALCKEHSKAMIFVDEPEIGKTVTAQHLAATVNNCFYLDCSQSKTRILFVRAFAKALGITRNGTAWELKEAVKARLNELHRPVVILDEAGDLQHEAFLELKEYWNATEGRCGWYLMGADGLRSKLEGGIKYQKVGYRELFSRFSGRYLSIVPANKADRQAFYSELITDVLKVNSSDKAIIPKLVTKCLNSDAQGEIAGLRRAETLLILHQTA
jgi:DNA transposition AAA+ family ATPase